MVEGDGKRGRWWTWTLGRRRRHTHRTQFATWNPENVLPGLSSLSNPSILSNPPSLPGPGLLDLPFLLSLLSLLKVLHLHNCTNLRKRIPTLHLPTRTCWRRSTCLGSTSPPLPCPTSCDTTSSQPSYHPTLHPSTIIPRVHDTRLT